MRKVPSTVKLKTQWKIDSPIIVKANAFRSIYTPQSTVLYFGVIDPEDMLQGSQKAVAGESTKKGEKIAEIKTLARYCLDHDDLLRLKKEIDKTVEAHKKTGVIKK